jgi:2-oxo-4-hydroxy-4-carboxy-5-ureidoimidazoline decarboxylase
LADPSPSERPAVDARLSVAAVDAFDAAAFVARFGDVAEHSPWVAERAAAMRPFADREAMIAAFAAAVDAADEAAQLSLLNAHPDLAGRAAIAGAIADDSKREQAGAGLDRLTAAEHARFLDLNDRYKARFHHPFILAVKGATKHDILAAFEARIGNTPDVERATALAQVKRIFRFRLEDRVQP